MLNRLEDNAAQWRRQRRIDRIEGRPRDDRLHPHPAGGGADGYPIIFRRKMILDYQQGRPVLGNMIRSIQRWIQRELPFCMTENQGRRTLFGEYFFILVLYKMIWSQATYLECIAAISNMSVDTAIFT